MTIRSVITYTLIGLAAIGLVSMLIYTPGALARQLAVLAVTAVVIYFLYRLVIRKRLGGSTEDKAFAKAAKHSKKRLQKRQKPSSASPSSSKKKKPFRRKSTSHLTVIDGKKGKRNNRASS
ncbi:SA1362 family protein [Bacillus sp. B190/17]|uniref:SA1362 family protein n=1 Tax=Bacillus lumedeiriae TaxID=3058829 RepID=A0ABW8I4E4_9BACI